MSTAVIAATIPKARDVAEVGDVLVTPRTLDRLRGTVIDRVAFAVSANRLNSTERINVAEAVAAALHPIEAGNVLRSLNAWCDRAPEPDISSRPSGDERVKSSD